MSQSLSKGQVVDRYEVVRSLGVGGMADVHLVKHRTLGTLHALKHLTYRSTDVDSRFLREGRVQAALVHPHIVCVRDVLDVPEGPCLVLDYVDGPDLYDVVETYALSTEESLGLAHGILRALAFAHGRSVVHRDLKLQNILLERRAPYGLVPRLVDFGLAKITHGPRGMGPRTGTGMMMGTPAYMAPEQMRDAKRVTASADLFSFGAVLYACFMGRPPWPGSSVIEVVRKRRQGAPLRVDSLREDVPPAVGEVVSALLAPKAEDRPSGAIEVMVALGLDPEPVEREVPPVNGPGLERFLVS